MNSAQSQAGVVRGWREARVFWILAFMALSALAMYIGFIGKAVFSIVENRQVTAENRALSADISELELKALALNDSISIEKALALGFVSANNTEYVAPTIELSQR